MKKSKKKLEFSKAIMVQNSVLVWLTTIAMLVLAYICVFKGFFGELPWLAVMAGLPWAAYGVDQAVYYQKTTKENTKNGIIFESAMRGLTTKDDTPVG